jgi:hypothetical protein
MVRDCASTIAIRTSMKAFLDATIRYAILLTGPVMRHCA